MIQPQLIHTRIAGVPYAGRTRTCALPVPIQLSRGVGRARRQRERGLFGQKRIQRRQRDVAHLDFQRRALRIGGDRALHAQRTGQLGLRRRLGVGAGAAGQRQPEIVQPRIAVVAYAGSLALSAPIQLPRGVDGAGCQRERGVLFQQRRQRHQRDAAHIELHRRALFSRGRRALRPQGATLFDLQRGFKGNGAGGALGCAIDVFGQQANVLKIQCQRGCNAEILKRHVALDQLKRGDLRHHRRRFRRLHVLAGKRGREIDIALRIAGDGCYRFTQLDGVRREFFLREIESAAAEVHRRQRYQRRLRSRPRFGNADVLDIDADVIYNRCRFRADSRLHARPHTGARDVDGDGLHKTLVEHREMHFAHGDGIDAHLPRRAGGGFRRHRGRGLRRRGELRPVRIAIRIEQRMRGDLV